MDLANNTDWSGLAQVQQRCLAVRWELLKAGYLDSKWVVDQWWLFDPKLPLRGVPVEYLPETEGEDAFTVELQGGILLMLYLIHVEHLEDTGHGEMEPERDRLVLEVLQRIKPANADIAQLIGCIQFILPHYHQRKFCTHFEGSLSAEDQAIREKLYSDMKWVQSTMVVEYFKAELARLCALNSGN